VQSHNERFFFAHERARVLGNITSPAIRPVQIQGSAFPGIFPLTIRAYMLIFWREGKKRMGKRKRDHDGVFWGKAEIGKAEIRKSGFLLSDFPISSFPADGGGIPRVASHH
jgi:hypothetical protein